MDDEAPRLPRAPLLAEGRDLLLCPVCSEPLSERGRTVLCPDGHSFDVSREGYVNLLLQKPGGDTREMLLARRRFLERGHYRPISEAVNGLVAQHLSGRKSDGEPARCILEVGCGEGYYLRALAREIGMEGQAAGDLVGIDNSKDAVRLAARRSRDMRFVVGDVHDVIPLITDGAEVLLDIFAPRNPPEFARVLAPGGLLVIVIPAPGHLSKLGSSVPMLGMEEGKEERLLKDFGSSFRWMGTRPVEYNAAVSGEEAVDLVTMSPSYRHTEPQAIQSLLSIPEVNVDVRVRIVAFERTTSTGTVVIDPCD